MNPRRALPASLAAVWLATLANPARASPPSDADASAARAATTSLSGRVIEAGGSRQGVSAAVVLVVEAPADVRPGQQPRDALDPEAITWMRQAETDPDGNFTIDDIPIGNIRIVVVAGGYARLEQWAALPEAHALTLYLRPEAGAYRTEVRTQRRSPYAIEPEHVLDGQTARRYAGAGDDPLLAAQNLPGIARSPLGLGMVGFRGGNPNEAGHYLDGHPIPRSFHVLPIASVLAAPMTARVQLSPGNYSAAFGGFGGGLIQLDSRPGRRNGIHGESHIDLFDIGTTIEGPVGDGAVHVGVRRSFVGDVMRAIPTLPIGSPHFWDYLTRFDHPLGRGHELTLRALGAGDRLTDDEFFDFSAAFHRFDLEYRRTSEDWQILLSPSLRLDSSTLEQTPNELRRVAQVYSVRVAFTRRKLTPILDVEFGADAVVERWQIQQRSVFTLLNSDGTQVQLPTSRDVEGDQLRAGAWISLPLELRSWTLVPSLRANLFAYSGYPRFRPDPRIDLRGRVHERVELHAALGLYATPVVLERNKDSELIVQGGAVGDAVADVPQYLIAYFDPNIATDVESRSAGATWVVHASMGVQVQLPWQLEASATGFWREGLPTTLDRLSDDPYRFARRRSFGLELLLRRSLARDVIDGWLGYTLMSARVEQQDRGWEPAVFDQRHNFVALLGINLPRGYRVGLRFRLVSGNPESPIVGRQVVARSGRWFYVPLRAPRGTAYQPLFHQLDIRLDKRWTLDRTSVTAYLDVQNVYNRIYPEVWLYTRDWAERRSLIGLPIYPSLGVQVEF